MFNALQDIKIQTIDFDWINTVTKISHLKRAIKIIEQDGDYYPELKDACYKRIQQIDPTQKRLISNNHVSLQVKQQLEKELLQWETSVKIKQSKTAIGQANLEDVQSYFSNQTKINEEKRKILAEQDRTKGNQAIKSKDFDEAISYYTSSINNDPGMYQSYGNRALAYLKKKEFQKCINDCESCLRLNKNYVKAYHRKAKALMGQKKNVQGYRCLQQGLKIQPQNSEMLKQLKQLREQMTPNEINQLQKSSSLISKTQFKKITIQEDSQQDD